MNSLLDSDAQNMPSFAPNNDGALLTLNHLDVTTLETFDKDKVPFLTVSPWTEVDWEAKAASARPPYTPSYASFNSPGSNLSALSGALEDEYEYTPTNDTNAPQSYSALPEEGLQYSNHLAFHTGTPPDEFGNMAQVHDPSSSSTPYTLLEDHFPGATAATSAAASAEEFFVFPSDGNGARDDLSNQGQGPQLPQDMNQMYGYYPTPASRHDYSPSPPSSSGDADTSYLQQQRPSYELSSHSVNQLAHQPSPMLGNVAPPAGFSERLADLSVGGGLSGDASASSALSSQSSITSSTNGNAARISSRNEALLTSQRSQFPVRPPGLQDFFGTQSESSTGSQMTQPAPAPPPASFSPQPPVSFGHRVRAASHSGTSTIGLGLDAFYDTSTSSSGPTTYPISWPEGQSYYSTDGNQGASNHDTSSTIDPRNAAQAGDLYVLPPSPPARTQQLSPYQPPPLLSVTQHHPGISTSSPHTPSSLPSTSASTLTPGWDTGSAVTILRRNKTTGSTGGHYHRRNAHSEDIKTLSPFWQPVERSRSRELETMDQAAFLRRITSADGSLAPPSSSDGGHRGSGLGYPGAPPSGDALGLGAVSGSQFNPKFEGDDEDMGGVGAQRGRRRGSSASSHSPYSRQLSISPSPSSNPRALSSGSDYTAVGPVAKAEHDVVVPVHLVERQHVTTPATELASQSRRKNKAPFVCPVEGCGSTFTRQFNLKGHLRSHREERPYVCKWENCNKGFARQHDCKRHEALHLNIRPFNCDGCGKTFARMDALNRHHKSEGGNECRGGQVDDTPVAAPAISTSNTCSYSGPPQTSYYTNTRSSGVGQYYVA